MLYSTIQRSLGMPETDTGIPGGRLFEPRQCGHRHGRHVRTVQAGRGRAGYVCGFHPLPAMGSGGVLQSDQLYRQRLCSAGRGTEHAAESITAFPCLPTPSAWTFILFPDFLSPALFPTNLPIYVSQNAFPTPTTAYQFLTAKQPVLPFPRTPGRHFCRPFRTADLILPWATPTDSVVLRSARPSDHGDERGAGNYFTVLSNLNDTIWTVVSLRNRHEHGGAGGFRRAGADPGLLHQHAAD